MRRQHGRLGTWRRVCLDGQQSHGLTISNLRVTGQRLIWLALSGRTCLTDGAITSSCTGNFDTHRSMDHLQEDEEHFSTSCGTCRFFWFLARAFGSWIFGFDAPYLFGRHVFSPVQRAFDGGYGRASSDRFAPRQDTWISFRIWSLQYRLQSLMQAQLNLKEPASRLQLKEVALRFYSLWYCISAGSRDGDTRISWTGLLM